MKTRSNVAALFFYNSCLATFLSYGVFFTRVSAELNLPATSTALVFGVFAAMYSVSSLLMGLFMNARGPRTTILLGGSLMGAGLALSALANSFPLLLATYGVIGGLGSGATWLTTSYVVFDRFDADKVPKVTGLVSAGTAAGLLYFSPLESYLISAFGLQAAFLAVGGVVLLFTLTAYLSTEESSAVVRIRLTDALRALKTGRFRYLYVYYAFGNAFARTLVIIFMVPLFESRGIGAAVGPLALALVGVGSLAGRLTTGTHRIREETVAAVGFLLQGACAVGLYFSSSVALVAVFALLFGVGYGAYIPEFALLVRKYFGVESYGSIFGTLLTSFGIGAFIGSAFEGSEVSSTGGFIFGFLLAAGASIVVGTHLLLGRVWSRAA
ncbi:MAG: MFS transporter [Nitrososphaerales archaeon]|nr:MFS transporter [Nitrososphaerales archaeon]